MTKTSTKFIIVLNEKDPVRRQSTY